MCCLQGTEVPNNPVTPPLGKEVIKGSRRNSALGERLHGKVHGQKKGLPIEFGATAFEWPVPLLGRTTCSDPGTQETPGQEAVRVQKRTSWTHASKIIGDHGVPSFLYLQGRSGEALSPPCLPRKEVQAGGGLACTILMWGAGTPEPLVPEESPLSFFLPESVSPTEVRMGTVRAEWI